MPKHDFNRKNELVYLVFWVRPKAKDLGITLGIVVWLNSIELYSQR